MKPKQPATPAIISQNRSVAAALLAAATIVPATAADYYWTGGSGDWDLGIYNGTVVSGTGGSTNPNSGAYYDTDGTWTSGTANWQNSARDTSYYWVNPVNTSITSTTGPTGPWMPSSEIRGAAIFDVAGGGLVKVADATAVRSAGIFTGSINFKTNGYELYSDAPGGARMETSFGSGILIDPGVTAKIGSGISVWLGGSHRVSGGGTLNVTGSIATLAGNPLRIANDTTVNLQTGGTLGALSNQLYVGSDGAGTLNIDGGTVVIGNSSQNRSLILATGTSTYGVVSMNSGAINITNTGTSHLQLGDAQTAATKATFSLNGGTVSTPYINSGNGTGVNSTFNFNGGTIRSLRDTATFMEGLDNAYVQAGGAVFDTNNRSITVGQALLHDSALGSTRDGGLTKNNTGTLSLLGINSYTGDTVINGGTLSIDNAYLFDLGNVRINGAESIFDLDFIGTDTIAALYFDGVAADLGTWGAPSSGADHESEFLTGSGFLNVTAIPEPPTAWLLVGLAGCMSFRRRR